MWKYESYLKKGISHIQSETNCQDSVLIEENDQCIIAALADGLGSLAHSDIAAQTVTKGVCDIFLNSQFSLEFFQSDKENEEVKNELIKKIKDRLIVKADKMGISLDDMDCTLAFVYISKQYDYAFVGRLGDSSVCVIKKEESISLNDSNKSANGTNAILDRNSNETLELFKFKLDDGLYGFILSSDGLENEVYTKGSKHVNKAAEHYFNAVSVGLNPKNEIISAIENLTKCKDSPFDDDISIGVLSCINIPVSFNPDPTWLCCCGARNRIQDTYCKDCHKDFSVLYKNIIFKEYGGKAAFFSKINGNVEEEMKMLEVSTQESNDIRNKEIHQCCQSKTQHPSSTMEKSENHRKNEEKTSQVGVNDVPQKNKQNQKKKKNNWSDIIIVMVLIIIGMVIGSLVSSLTVSKNIKELSTKVDDLASVIEQQNVNMPSQETTSQNEPFSDHNDKKNEVEIDESNDNYADNVLAVF